MRSETDRLKAIRDKVESGQRLSFDDGMALEASNDLFALGSMANLVRERYNGNFTYFNVNTHINPTNVCVYTCDFCAFRADLGEDRAYVMDRDQIVERARQASGAAPPSCTLSAGSITSCHLAITSMSCVGSGRRRLRFISKPIRPSRLSGFARFRQMGRPSAQGAHRRWTRQSPWRGRRDFPS